MARNFGTGHIAISADVARCDERLKNCQSSAFKVKRNASPAARRYEKLIHGLTHVKGLGTVGTMRHMREVNLPDIFYHAATNFRSTIAASCIFHRATVR